MFGVISTSLLVVTITNILDMSQVENKAFTCIKLMVLKNDLKDKAAFVITKACRLHLSLKKGVPIRTNKVLSLNRSIERFKRCLRRYNNQKGNDSINLSDIQEKFGELKATNQETMLYLSVLGEMVRGIQDHLGIQAKQYSISEVLRNAQNRKELKQLKNLSILREYVRLETQNLI